MLHARLTSLPILGQGRFRRSDRGRRARRCRSVGGHKLAVVSRTSGAALTPRPLPDAFGQWNAPLWVIPIFIHKHGDWREIAFSMRYLVWVAYVGTLIVGANYDHCRAACVRRGQITGIRNRAKDSH